MDIQELKQMINQKCGVPYDLLTADDPAALIDQARQLLTFREAGPKSTRQQFSDLLSPVDHFAELDAISETLKRNSQLYPDIPDSGNLDPGDGRDKYSRFAEMLADQLSFDPRKDGAGWR